MHMTPAGNSARGQDPLIFDIKNYHETNFSSELKVESNLMFVI